MNKLFKNFNNGNQKVSSKEFTAYPTVNFHGEITLIRGGLEQEVSYTSGLYEMNIKGYVSIEDWDIQEHLSNSFNGLPIDDLHAFKNTLKESGLQTLSDSLTIPNTDMTQQLALQLMSTSIFKKVFGKNTIIFDSLSDDEKKIVNLTHFLAEDRFEKLTASSYILKDYVTTDEDGNKVKPDRSVVEIALFLLQEAQTKKK